MDEMVNTNEVVEEAAQVEEPVVEEPAEEEVSDSIFDTMMDSDEYDDMFAEEVSDDADQQTEEPEATEPAEEPDTDQWLELKHFDEVRRVSKEEAKALAQKGMDYDRIRGKVDKLQKYEDFLNEIKGDFASLEDLMDDTRARLKADKDGISYEDALNKIKEEPAKTKQTRDEILEQIRQESIQQFAADHPDIQAQDIPQEVWEDVFKTNNLEASYAKYVAQKMKNENDVLKRNAKNKSRSTGSMKSSGNSSLEKSEFDRVLESDDW